VGSTYDGILRFRQFEIPLIEEKLGLLNAEIGYDMLVEFSEELGGPQNDAELPVEPREASVFGLDGTEAESGVW
jgi:hypothetical protein